MAETLSEGVTIPNHGDYISPDGDVTVGVHATRALGMTANAAIGAAKFQKGILGNVGPYDLFALDTGVYTISNATAAEATANIPEVWPGVAVVWANAQSPLKSVQYYPHQRDYWYTTTSASFTTMLPWKKMGEGQEGAPGADADLGQTHAVRRSIFKRRRGGVIGTGGKPVVALRFDHGLNNFKNLVLPELIRLGLPGSMAMNSAPNRWDLPESNEVTPAMLDGYAVNNGIEVWNHSQTHGGAEDLASLTREVVTGLTELQAQIPSVPIEGFVIPGVPSGNYGGFSAGEDAGRWDTMAGRLILGYHAVSSSHMAGTDGPLTGDQPVLSRQMGVDSMSASSSIAAINRAVAAGAGMTVFLHPSQLDLSGKITTAAYTQVLEHIAALRDSGAVEVLSMGGLSIADVTRDYRHDLAVDPEFTSGLAAWGSPSGWSTDSDGGVTTGISSANLSQTASLSGREWAQGSPRELVARVRSRGGGTLNVELTLGATTRLFTIPEGTEGWIDVRVQGIVPLTASTVNVQVRRESGDYLHVQSVRLRAV